MTMAICFSYHMTVVYSRLSRCSTARVYYWVLQQQMKVDRELTNMLVNDLKNELLEALRNSNNPTQNPPEREPPGNDNRQNHQRDYPAFRPRSFTNLVATMDHRNQVPAKPDPVSMVPHNEYVVQMMKKDIVKETSDLATLLLNIDMHERYFQGDANSDPALNNLKATYIQRATTLESNKMLAEKAATMASCFSANLEMPKYRRPPPGKHGRGHRFSRQPHFSSLIATIND